MAETEILHAPLTEQQASVLAAISSFQREHGYSPTVREIQELTGASSPSNIHDRLRVLREKRLVTWVEDSPRTLVLTPRGRKAL